jgi:hypothetical protein
MKRISCALLFAAACAADAPSDDVTGPYTGATHRYVVDRFSLPTNNTQARETADDMDGDGVVDNQLGMVISTIHGQGLYPEHVEDMIASGALASSFEITADDLANDDTVSVLYRGNDASSGVAVGGHMVDGTFRSNRSATTHVPGHAFAMLPVFADADASEIEIGDLEIDLYRDGSGGFDAIVRGTVDPQAALKEAYRSSMQMVAADPDGHFYFMALFDQQPRDWVITEDEFTQSSFIESLFEPDVEMHGSLRLSIGFKLHLSPCDQGVCASSPPSDTCHDRARDGDESDVDCGGSCGVCPGGATCSANTDCDSQQCDGTNHCAQTSCTDGVRDGFETDVDCGSNCGKTCTAGQRCHGSDCVEGLTCGPECNDPLTCDYPYFSTCQ